MANSYRLALWNANGLAQHSQEVKAFINIQKIDLMLIAETHFTDRHFFRIPGYTFYNTNHPTGEAHGGAAIIIRSSIKHFELPKYETEKIQATQIQVTDSKGPITIAAAYCPPKHTIKNEDFKRFFGTLGCKFIAGADYNAKHQQWGSRVTQTRGRELLKTVDEKHLSYLTTGEPTYWPTDTQKLPDLLDFFVAKGIINEYTHIKSCLDLSSDHSPVILTVSSVIIFKEIPLKLHSKDTDWELFRRLLDEITTLDVPLKSEEDIDNAVDKLTRKIQEATWQSTPNTTSRTKTHDLPMAIKIAITEKRRLRRVWQYSRHPHDKGLLNNAAQNLKRMLYRLKNDSLQKHLEELSPTDTNDYSLWRATRNMKQPIKSIPPIRKANGGWARSNEEKAELFANHLSEVFQPFPSQIEPEEDNEIAEHLETPLQMSLPFKAIKWTELENTIRSDLNLKKAPGYDLITGKILKELPEKVLRLITFIFNAMLRIGYFPDQWKVAQIIVIPKPGKPPNEVASYRPISLLPIISKIFEKLFLKRLQPILKENEIIPIYQFGFRQEHSTIEQVHRIVDNINKAFEEKEYCTVAMLDISQAFDKVWHQGLLYKIRQYLPHSIYGILQSYLSDRSFMVKFQSQQTSLHPIQAGVPQGSVLGPILYTLYTADLPVTENTQIATYADDTALQAINIDPIVASRHLQEQLNETQIWLKKWRIRANESKSVQITFTMRRQTCPPVTLNGQELKQADSVKYLGIHLDRRLTWRTHIWSKRKQLNLKLAKLNWLIGRKSRMSLGNKLLIYKSILKPIWTYGIPLWGTARNSNIEILQRYQSKVLRIITGSPWYIPNTTLHRDLAIPTVKEEVCEMSRKYQTRLETHPNYLAVNLLDNSRVPRRLNRQHPTDLFQ